MGNKYRLSKKEDFSFLFNGGRRIDSPLFRLVYRKNSIGHVRLALIAPRSIEKRAVLRNRLRRRTREWARKYKGLMNQPLDSAVVFRKEAITAPRNKLYEELEKIFARINII